MTDGMRRAGERESPRQVVVIGGGLAGMAAATRLAEQGLRVVLIESRRTLGGRAASFGEQELVDYCQHVGMGCCTNWLDLCRRLGLADQLTAERRLHFIAADGRRCDWSPWRLPAPLHLLPGLLGLSLLSWRERWSAAAAVSRLARDPPDEAGPTAAEWLRRQRQSERALSHFWSPVLVSALGESLDVVSAAAARHVLVEGFLAHPTAPVVWIPRVPLGELYDRRGGEALTRRGIEIRTRAPAISVRDHGPLRWTIRLRDGEQLAADGVVVAVPWRRVRELLGDELVRRVPGLSQVNTLHAAPISAIHLWFDRRVVPLPHAVLLERLAQWVFHRGECPAPNGEPAVACQVVVSGAHELVGRERTAIRDQLVDELLTTWPGAAGARLVDWRIVTDSEAVLSMRPGVESARPPQRTPLAGLALGGDWTRTGWPSTMEGAVRSGYLAAESVLTDFGRPARLLVPPLRRNPLVRALAGRERLAGAQQPVPPLCPEPG